MPLIETAPAPLLEKLPADSAVPVEGLDQPTWLVRRESLKEVAKMLGADASAGFDLLLDVCGVDYPGRAERFEVVYHERTVGKVLHRLGFRHVSTRARHPEADEQKQEAFKKTSPRW